MNLLQCSQSSIIAEMDEHAFTLNMLIQNQQKENSLEDFRLALKGYAKCASELEVLEKLKEQIAEVAGQSNEDAAKENTKPKQKRQYPSGLPPKGSPDDITDEMRETFEKYQEKFENGEDYTDEILGKK